MAYVATSTEECLLAGSVDVALQVNAVGQELNEVDLGGTVEDPFNLTWGD